MLSALKLIVKTYFTIRLETTLTMVLRSSRVLILHVGINSRDVVPPHDGSATASVRWFKIAGIGNQRKVGTLIIGNRTLAKMRIVWQTRKDLSNRNSCWPRTLSSVERNQKIAMIYLYRFFTWRKKRLVVAMVRRRKIPKLDHFDKARGGRKQRLARLEEERQGNDSGSFVRSELAHYLLSRFAWGELSPQELQKIAQLAIRDVDSFHASSKATLSSSSSATPAESKLLELRALSKIGVAGNMALQQ